MKKNETKKNNSVTFEMNNTVNFNGTIKNVLSTTEKVSVYNVEIPTKSPKGNTIKAWVKVVDFNKEFDFEEGDVVTVSGALSNNVYEGKTGKVFELRVIADTIQPIE